jgi:hypothetical protein
VGITKDQTPILNVGVGRTDILSPLFIIFEKGH